MAGSILLAYLFETDAQLLQFLDDLQLRYLFTVLVGAFSALAALCADLADPFRGSFTIAPSAQQLECIRDLIAQESCRDLPERAFYPVGTPREPAAAPWRGVVSPVVSERRP